MKKHSLKGLRKEIRKLKEIQISLKHEFRNFPSNCCKTAAEKVMERLGFKGVDGLYLDNKGSIYYHCWNMTRDGYIIDITVNQFNNKLPEIYITKRSSKEAQKHYITADEFLSDLEEWVKEKN